MRPVIKQPKKTAFTIVELLVVMSIIIILIGLLVPGLNRVRRYAKLVAQKNQFHSIGTALDLFHAEADSYPPSDANDGAEPDPQPYCGAMKLAEAMVGQDLLGFHPDSRFRADGEGPAGKDLYDETAWNAGEWAENLKTRRGPYLPLEGANAYRLEDLYENATDYGGEELAELFVLCDVYKLVTPQDLSIKGRIGMPVLYYRADVSGTKNPHVKDDGTEVGDIDDGRNIYDYEDNDELVLLGIPWSTSGADHPMASSGTTLDDQQADPLEHFYDEINNDNIDIEDGRPYRSDSYILLSAGFDGEYGTPDDVFNFEK
jgi:type II secretory pathway pseudopilin PulG